MHISDLKGKKVLVVGLGKTGTALARLLAGEGALVTINDIHPEEELASILKELAGVPCRSEFGIHKTETFLDQDLILVSPGVPLQQKAFREAQLQRIPIYNDLELAYSLTATPFVAIAGTNGKTTTASLMGDIFRRAGKQIVFGGNIGFPLSPLVYEQPEAEFIIAEVSSFQLETIQTFRPWVGIMLNITPDHLDRYSGWNEYVQAKSRLFMNQTGRDFSIVNAQDSATSQLLAQRRGLGKLLFFRTDASVKEGVMIQGKDIVARLDGREELICSINRTKLPGEHNRQNTITAALAAWLCGIEGNVIQRGIEEFDGLWHRIEFVAEIDGVRFIDDSKGTNVGAVIKAIQSLKEPIWLILGGKDKENDYYPLVPVIENRVKGILAVGESKEKIKRFFRGKTSVYSTDSLREAVYLGFSLALPGDTVLLSPACASFDMFKSYEHRGQVFKQIVQEIENAQTANL